MNKIYLIYGDEEYFINNEINKLKKEYLNYDLVEHDMLEENISVAIEDAEMMSLFSNTKLIICYNCYFLTPSKCDIDHDIESLLKYIKIDSDTVFVLVVNSELDNRKKIVKELSKFNVIRCSKLKDYELGNFIKEYWEEVISSLPMSLKKLFVNFEFLIISSSPML